MPTVTLAGGWSPLADYLGTFVNPIWRSWFAVTVYGKPGIGPVACSQIMPHFMNVLAIILSSAKVTGWSISPTRFAGLDHWKV